MLLCADIGNSHTTFGLLDGGDVLDHWRVATDERRTADEWAVLIKSLLADSAVPGAARVAVCSTVPSVLHEWRDMLRGYFGDVPHVGRARRAHRGAGADGQPARGRLDRIINALAAAHLYDGPSIVVDFGTATFDVVSEGGVRRRRDRARHRDLARGPRPPRRACGRLEPVRAA